MHSQKGVTITGLVLVSIVVVLLLILSFKVVPVYTEYFTIQKLFRSMAEDPAVRGARRAEIERVWAARTSIDTVRSLPAENIEVTKDGEGILISAEYSVKVPIFRNVSLYFDFHPTSKQ